MSLRCYSGIATYLASNCFLVISFDSIECTINTAVIPWATPEIITYG